MAEPLKPLTIGLVLDTSLDPPDGVQQYVIGLGEWLRSQGHAVHYLVGQTKRSDLPNIHSLSRNVRVKSNGNWTTIPLYARRRDIRRLLKEVDFDVLHVQIPHHPLMAQRIVLAADRRTAIIGTFHIAAYSWLETAGTKALGWWLRPSLKRFDRILSVSAAAARFAARTFGVKTEVLPNVIDWQHFHAARPLPQYDDGLPTILFLGRLVPRKGCRRLLEAIAILAKDSTAPRFRAVICGKGPEAPQLAHFIKENGLSDSVEMVGFVSEADKPRYYASADIAVFPSSGGESFGIVLLEAMAGGRAAVLAGDNPGYRSVMEPQPELLFDATDAEALASRLKAYLMDDKRRQAAADWGAAYSRGFDTAAVGQKLTAIYREALRKRRQP
ncbi:MAG TPA: glycosyltransferase family 4 protein [Candidatus Saccharimonadales bacterium]|nr:glycosyltransferase family 4 protein [Candidatus Saccharimonadales bacterium]